MSETLAQSKAKNPQVDTAVSLTKDQETAFINYATNAQNALWTQLQLRTTMSLIDKRYQRELDYTAAQTKARARNNSGDANIMQNITIPIVMSQVESALSYMANVFLTGYPIFGVAADPNNIAAAMQIEAIIGENSKTAVWAPEFIKFFRDGLKYNIHALEVTWQTKTVNSIDPTPDNKRPSNANANIRQVNWNGNTVKRMDLYNTFWDTRVHPHEISTEGEFAGYTELWSRVRMKRYINENFTEITKPKAIAAFESPALQLANQTSSSAPFSYYYPMINPNPKVAFDNTAATFNWLNWSMNKGDSTGIKYTNSYAVTILYARIIPADFDLSVPGPNTPQIWKLTIINGAVVLKAERLSNAHNMIPILFGQPISDGLDYQTKSYADNVADYQDLASALWNTYVASQRRLMTDRVIYDPSRIREVDINSPNPSAKIPVRAAAYGKPIGDSVHVFPFRNDNAGSLIQAADMVTKYANLTNSQNPAQQGQFVKGNKTLKEYEDVMGHGNGPNQLMALQIEDQVFVPLKNILLLNILQFQQDGEIYNPATRQSVTVDQLTIRQKAVAFTISDGLVPKDKEMGTEELGVALQVLGSSPQLASGYNMAPLFSYLMSLKGAHIQAFEKSPMQMQYEQQMGAWQQAAAEAAKQGTEFSSPQPQPTKELQDEMNQKQQLQQQQSNSSGAITAALQRVRS